MPETVIPKISQETLAEMIGTTRSRVSFFMNRFREHGFIDYDDGGLTVHSGLLSVISRLRVGIEYRTCLVASICPALRNYETQEGKIRK